MSNLYAGTRNEFRLYDVEGVILASPNDYILIREPRNFKSIPITLERDADTHGVFFEFGDENTLLAFSRAMKVSGEVNDPYNLIKSIYESQGVDGKLQFELLNWNGTSWVSQYKADVDLETISIEDYKIDVNTRRILLSDKVRTRLSTPVNLDSTTSIDGTVIGATPKESMFLHSKNNILEQLSSSQAANASFFVFEQDDWVLQLDLTSERILSGYNNNLFSKYGQGVPTQLYHTGGNLNQINNHLNFKGARGVLSISWRSQYQLTIGGTIATNGEHFGSFVKVNDVEYQIGAAQGTGGSANPFVKSINVFGSIDVFIPLDATVSFYEKWGFFTGLNTNSQYSIGVTEGVSSNDRMIIEFTEYVDNSFADTYPLFDSINHILESINDSNNVLESSFITTELDSMKLTDGFKIRDFSRETTLSFSKVFRDGIQKMFGLGYAIYDDSGTDKLLIERYSEFYKNEEIITIEDVEDGSLVITVDKDLICNEIEAGYEDFPKATDENKQGNLDEVNTVHEYITPIKTIKKKATYVSSIIASGYLIENSRREQFKDIPSDTVNNDTNPFIINSISSSSYTGLTMSFLQTTGPVYYIDIEATYLNISVGDVITISNSAVNNKNFTIEEISYDLTGNVNFLKGVRLTVTESNTIDDIDTGITLSKASSFLRALRDEEFETLTGVNSPDTSYNIGLNPKYLLFNHAPLLNSGFNPKSGSEVIKAQDVKLNSAMTCRFANGEGDYTLDPDRETISMGGNLTLNQMNNYGRLFTGRIIKFTTSIGYDEVLTIRDACLNQASSANFGYIFVRAGASNYKGFVMSMVYTPTSEKVDFTLRELYE